MYYKFYILNIFLLLHSTVTMSFKATKTNVCTTVTSMSISASQSLLNFHSILKYPFKHYFCKKLSLERRHTHVYTRTQGQMFLLIIFYLAPCAPEHLTYSMTINISLPWKTMAISSWSLCSYWLTQSQAYSWNFKTQYTLYWINKTYLWRRVEA